MKLRLKKDIGATTAFETVRAQTLLLGFASSAVIITENLVAPRAACSKGQINRISHPAETSCPHFPRFNIQKGKTARKQKNRTNNKTYDQ